ncbi:Uncharacterised protein [Ewingella americana]|uniref:Uncharacterized protein n=1 Tax=Ewingella americana TaxID=41202 RepID=A0A377NGA6_9GAMM|nr:Uncharacterised protein [Ewingella americana]
MSSKSDKSIVTDANRHYFCRYSITYFLNIQTIIIGMNNINYRTTASYRNIIAYLNTIFSNNMNILFDIDIITNFNNDFFI